MQAPRKVKSCSLRDNKVRTVYDQPQTQGPLSIIQAEGLEQLPLFTYGTLRRGQENYALLRGNTLNEIPATLEGVALYSLYAYPMIVEGNSVVHGELLTLHPRLYSRVLGDLDQLEGFQPDAADGSRFRRIERHVKTDNGVTVLAWVYVGNPSVLLNEPHVQIPHGDWCRYRHDLIRGTRF